MKFDENIRHILILTLIFALVTGFNSFSKDLELIKEKSFNVKFGQVLNVRTDLGDIIIKTWDSEKISVKIYGDDDAENNMEFSFDQDEGGVSIFGDKKGGKIFSWFRSIDLKYEVKVPNEFDLNLKTSGGDLSVVKLSGEFTLKTSGGDIYLKHTRGEALAETSGGNVILKSHNGNSRLSTSGGDIKANTESGDLNANTSGGDILLESSNGNISAKTSGGDIELSYAGESLGINLRTSGGDIDVKLPMDFDANVELRTSGGDLTNKFSNNKMTKVTKSQLIGKFNNGGAPLVCKTSGGDITVIER